MIKFVARNLRFHARSHAGAALGVAVATAVLVGALAVGDCVRGSLRDLALARLGKTEFALVPADRFFRDDLARRISPSPCPLAAVALRLPGIASAPDESARANAVQILGVDSNFWALAQNPPSLPAPGAGAVILNEPLARQLHVNVGDTILLRVQKPSLLSSDDPLAARQDVAAALRLTVAAVVTGDQFGAFSLRANQAPPMTAFLPLARLQNAAGLDGRANILLTGPTAPGQDLAAWWKQHWLPGDLDLELRDLPAGVQEIRSDRVFIDPAVAAARAGDRSFIGMRISTYFVNELRDRSNATPYSTVAGIDPPLVTSDDQILINQWLADDLHAFPGDDLALSYDVLDDHRRLVTRTHHFRIHAIIPMRMPWADPALMPDFPGIAKAESTENWDAGFTIDMSKIRPQDEKYWRQWRGTPKAFITLAAAQSMWSNSFGFLTAIRYPVALNRADWLQKIDPPSLGLAFQPVREQALAASAQSQDLGQYFLAFSIFLVAAALILVALLFQFGVEKRATEIGVLLALGWRPCQVRRLLLLEGAGVAVIGGIAGVAGGIAYARAMLFGLAEFWSPAVNHSQLHFHVTAQTLAVGAASGVIVSLAVIWLALRGQARRPARELLEQGSELGIAPLPRRRVAGWIAVAGLIAAGAAIAGPMMKGANSNTGAFFGGGTSLLVAGVAVVAVWLRKLAAAGSGASPTLSNLGLRGCARRRNRSLAVIGLLASACFVIIAVNAFKLDASIEYPSRRSGTGGFALIGESALPIVQDLNTPAGRQFFGLSDADMRDVHVVPLRVHEGDDASCLNLNHPQTPRILGVEPSELAGRFIFAGAVTNASWAALASSDGAAVLAIADDASIQYSFGKSLGGSIADTDASGRPFDLRLTAALENSILQGNVVISDSAFITLFPGEGGYRMFLIDCPNDSAQKVSATLTRVLRDRGLQLTPAADRLDAFNAAQNSYLDAFAALGGLGLLLGSAGLGVVVLRNALERRAELAAMAAMGFSRAALRRLVLGEHAVLEILGLAIGAAAAMAAVLPSLLSPRAPLSLTPLAAALAAVFVSGLAWTWLAARLALRGPLLNALRNE